MAIVKVKRPKLSWHEHLYLPAILKGLGITLKHAIAALRGKAPGAEELASSGLGVTMQYPEQKWDARLPEYYRGVPALVTDEQGRERCVSCQLCEFICPPKAITILPGELQSDNPWSKVEKAPREFEINMIRCIYCGMCEEVCPEQAIFLRQDYAMTGGTRDEMVNTKGRLYKIGGMREGLVNKWNKLK
ncbi:MAG: NADH-quinone oxidoreductase subunit D [Roseibacillus sp.]|mgnify:FL=1|jgi:NADH-quinone oxidoreductase subunit I|nr:NADH-quinone oxidoreductase subunit D [Roseibacillus sp.]MBP35388.1 NADH-quinone oxidoreductase subunit D [Roseibacillus sp.]MCP4730493.1 4Fe-4S dicluster domain-containing protein [Roseibacillus sp.]MDP7106116.1 4Fe-4S binding protein [Roseibacillus sp.]MDP7309086.1 4Fe-4S binding protein [Roseibacillus sp.]|tara:strand:+ start:13445 stop:14011 length:567 start_codon:yes stop_codon:yes gene_type:complete